MMLTSIKLLIKSLAVAALLALVTTPARADDTGLASAIHNLRKERGRLCMSSHWHTSSGNSFKKKRAAKVSAIAKWRGFTDWEYGSDWANYKLAVSKSMKCHKSSRTTWACSVEARPCKSKRRRHARRRKR